MHRADSGPKRVRMEAWRAVEVSTSADKAPDAPGLPRLWTVPHLWTSLRLAHSCLGNRSDALAVVHTAHSIIINFSLHISI
jgi:hypothetical protein